MDSLFTCPGFRASGICAGIKKNGKKDLGIITSDDPATAAAVFTQNRVAAAPVQLGRRRLSKNVLKAVVANSGNANCCTGLAGLADAEKTAALAAKQLNCDERHVVTASTGVIGQQLPMAAFEAGVPKAVAALSPEGFGDFAEAIMTTDTTPKLVRETALVEGKTVTILGCAKGAGMIKPQMATMLAFVCTDLKETAGNLMPGFREAVDLSLNRITIDGDTSTNDTALIMASGVSGASFAKPADETAFFKALRFVLLKLARWLVKDGEGVTKVVTVRIKGAADNAQAKKAAYTIAESPLVKTAFFGQDPNWGRIFMALGRSGIEFDPNRVGLLFDDAKLVENGIRLSAEAEAAVGEVMKKGEFDLTVNLHMGGGFFEVITSDLSVDYVKINADYRT